MVCLLLGRNGQVGQCLEARLKRNIDVIALGHKDLDVLNTRKLRHIINEIRPEILINATAYTNVDKAETEVVLATKINSIAPKIMAEEMDKINGCFIHFSTDYVFDGQKKLPYRETDFPNPVNVYGASKLYGEYLVKQACQRYLILRTSWVYLLNSNNFVTKVLNLANGVSELDIVDDQIGNPTSACMLADVIDTIINRHRGNLKSYFESVSGIYHCANKGSISRYTFAKKILFYAKKENIRVKPVSSSHFSMKASRPLDTSLSVSLFEETFDVKLPNWEDSLIEMFSNTYIL